MSVPPRFFAPSDGRAKSRKEDSSTDFPARAWFAFTAFILTMLALDLFVFRRQAEEVYLRGAAIFSGM